MKALNFKNIANIVLIILILVLSYLEINKVNSNAIVLVGIIDVLAILLLIINLFYKKTIIKEVELVKEVYINNENIEKNEDTEIFEIIEEKNEEQNIITSRQKEQNLENYVEKQLINLSKQFDIAQAVFYLKNADKIFVPVSTYAFYSETKIDSISEGEGIVGQAIKDKKMLTIGDIPDGYITILSGLGQGNPKSLLIVPGLIDNNVVAIEELASLNKFTEEDKNIINESVNKISENIINVH